MKKIIYPLCMLTLLSGLSSCSVVTGIFKAGMGFGIFLVVFVIALILFFVFKARNR